MKTLKITALALLLASSSLVMAADHDYEQDTKLITGSKTVVLPKARLLSTTVYRSCNSIASATLTFADGTVVIIDKEHHEGFDDVEVLVALIKTAPHVVNDGACENV